VRGCRVKHLGKGVKDRGPGLFGGSYRTFLGRGVFLIFFVGNGVIGVMA
jgi:hypothetical protein